MAGSTHGQTVMNEHATSALLPALLRALSNGEPRLADGVDCADIERLVESGLGPLLHRLRPANGFKNAKGSEALLHGADLTSRVLTSDLFAAVDEIVIALRSTGIEPTLLKGIAYASRYYPEPHLRIMGDVDVLVPAGAIDDSVGTLRRLG
ncbi:MAG TPA: nucleotidyltransferase family protein [Longimicrobiales bacterium]|nr:nucleotidyltransferase family protein [Longimicrobiales bacterium]